MSNVGLNPYELQSIQGFPDTLKIYRIKRSKFWQCRYFVPGRGLIRKSTRCSDKSAAIEFAKDFYETILLEQRSGRLTSQASFSAYAGKLLKRQESMVLRGELDRRMIVEERGKLNRDVLPALGAHHIGKISTAMIRDFIDQLSAERHLSPSSLKKYVVLIRKTFKTAAEENAIERIPIMPTIKGKHSPRTWFDEHEYKFIRETCMRMAEMETGASSSRDYSTRNRFHRGNMSFSEVYDFIIFMVNSFLRPSEWKKLQNHHIRIVDEGKKNQHLLISVPNPKTRSIDSVTMDVAVPVYKRILERNSAPDDYLFFNPIANRDYAARRMGEMFNEILEKCELKTDRYGQQRSIYSLRHTSLMFRILKGDSVDLVLLATNARTSVQMLEKFYLTDLKPQMGVRSIQSRRK